jgi:hypothetical protein
MADQELAEILSEYQNLAESEHQSFVSGLLHSATFAATVFSALQIYEVRGVQCCGTRNDFFAVPVVPSEKFRFRFRLRFWFRSPDQYLSVFQQPKNVYKKNLAFSMLEAASFAKKVGLSFFIFFAIFWFPFFVSSGFGSGVRIQIRKRNAFQFRFRKGEKVAVPVPQHWCEMVLRKYLSTIPYYSYKQCHESAVSYPVL